MDPYENQMDREPREDDDFRMQLSERLKDAEARCEKHAIERERFQRISIACRAALDALSPDVDRGGDESPVAQSFGDSPTRTHY